VSDVDWLPLLREIADRSDEISLGLFRSRDLHVQTKPDRSLVTEADLAVEKAARALVAERRPELAVYGEEEGEAADRGAGRLIIDPIDSTANFARGIPVYATLLAIEFGDEIVAGLVSAPALATRWYATLGGGAFRIGPGGSGAEERLRVSAVDELANAQLFHGSLGGLEGKHAPPGLVDLARATERQRGFGDFWQHMLVAEGGGEAAVDPIVAPWDIAPLSLIIDEAGGRWSTLAGERSLRAGSFVSTNGVLHEQVLAALGRSASTET